MVWDPLIVSRSAGLQVFIAYFWHSLYKRLLVMNWNTAQDKKQTIIPQGVLIIRTYLECLVPIQKASLKQIWAPYINNRTNTLHGKFQGHIKYWFFEVYNKLFNLKYLIS